MKLSKLFLLVAAFLLSPLAVHRGAGPSMAKGDPAPPATQPNQLDLLVIDGSTQQPLTNASVAVNTGRGDEQKRAVGADGHVIVPVPQSNGFDFIEISIHAPGYVGKILSWTANDKDPIGPQYTMAMERGVKIGGRIVDDADQPVAGAHVVLWMGRQQSAKSHERDIIDADDIVSASDGAWSFSDAPADFQSVEMGCWDYRYANGDSFPMKSLTPAQLHGGTEKYQLRRGVPVTGVVRDAAGKPLAGAEVLTGAQLCSNRVPPQKTDADGEFHYMATPGEQVTLTVTCKGFAPELKQFLMDGQKHETTIQLSKSKAMVGRIVGPKGEPVPFAWVYPDTWRGNRSLETRIRADKDGKFVWQDAPLDTVYCDVDGAAAGYLRESRVALTASDQEITVKLCRALSVSGSVVDARTNNPIDSFNVIHGISFGPDQSIAWQRHPGGQTKGHAGKFEFHSTWSYPGYAVRIESPGYLPAESRVFTADEGSVALEFKLTQGADLTATVLKPDGRPAANATAVLALAGQSAYIQNCREVIDQGCQQAKSGPDGKLGFPPQTGSFKLVVFSDDGYAEVDQDALSKSGVVKLQPWGKIEGVLKIAKKPAAGEQVAVQFKETSHDRKEARAYHQIETKTDADGKFTFDRVPPGQGISISRQVVRPMGGGMFMSENAETQEIDVAPGQSVQVALGGMGRSVTGHVVIPSELAVAQNWGFGVSCRIMTKEIMPQFPAMPDEIKNAPIERQKTWRKDFLKSDAGKAYRAAVENAQKKMHTYPLQISQDGTFHADGVAAGTYTLSVDIARKSGDSTCGSGDSIAAGSAEFTVPEMPGGRSDEPLEIPPVSMQIIKTVNVGDAAPDFSAKTLDGRDLKLADFRGKYVLLDFWATWCEPCVVEIPSVKAAYDAFGQSDRFVMISLSLDEKADDAAQYVKKNNLAWNQVFLPGQWEAATVKDYCVHGIPSIWLIGPDGKVIAKDLRGPAIRAAVESALGSKR